MKLFEGKSQTERNKIIAAIVLGVLAVVALYLAFGPSFSSSKVTVAAGSPTPKPAASPNAQPDKFKLPTQQEQDFGYTTTAISYMPGDFSAPDAGRNIFAFYEPPPPCPTCPTPQKPVVIVTPTPTPTPPIFISFVTPQSVYAGAAGFRLEVSGDKFTPETRIYFNQSEMPTTFVNGQRLVTNIAQNLIANEGQAQILVQTPDGKFYSNQVMLTVQAPPTPQFQYIGMIARKRYNNDTAYFQEQGKQTPVGARLNDVVGGRFRLISISAGETVFEDVNLGFKHRLQLYRPPPGTATTGGPRRGSFPNDGGYVPFNPGTPQAVPANPSGFPANMPRPANEVRIPDDKKDSNDDDNDDDGEEPK